MKILITQDTDWIKRNPGQQHHLADELSIRGHVIRVIDYDITWAEEREERLLSRRTVYEHISRTIETADVTVIRPRILRIPYLDYLSMFASYSKEIRLQLKEFEPDVLVAQSLLTNLLSIRLARKTRVPVIFHALEAQYTMVPRSLLKPIARLVEMFNFRKASATVVINEQLRDYAIKMGSNPNTTYVVRAGVDLKRYDPKMTGTNVRRKYGIQDNDLVIFFMGWLYRFSGLREVAVGLSRLHNDKVKLLVVGEGDAFRDLESTMKEYQLQNQMILAGRRPFEEIPELIAAADICILPAYNNDTMRDIVPIKMYEYMAMGKPVISTDLPGVRREFGEKHGVLYARDPHAVLDTAMRLVERGGLGEEGKRARDFVEGKDWEKVVESFEGIMNNLIQKKD